jgi:tRNA G37 N-methylase TrmD
MSALFAPYRRNEKVFDEAAINLLAGESHLLINAGRYDTHGQPVIEHRVID